MGTTVGQGHYDKGLALFKLGNVVDNIRDLTDVEETCVREARLSGCSWREIADVYGVTRQAVHARWASKVEVDDGKTS